uniref:Secreted protein n=1 Tax=Arundo donax TaxID=35708 RepID=A0A0A9FH64_ARUDO
MLLQRGQGSTLSGFFSFSLWLAASSQPDSSGGGSGELLGSSASTTSGCGDGSGVSWCAVSWASDSVEQLLPLC